MYPLHSLEPKQVVSQLHRALKKPEAHWQVLASGLLSQSAAHHSAPVDKRKTLLETFAASHPREAELLTARWETGATAAELAYEWRYSVDQINRQQQKALKCLATFVIAAEQAQRRQYLHSLRATLPRQYGNALIGRSAEAESIQNFLLSPNAPWIMVVNGAPGSGKSHLVFQAVQQQLRGICLAGLMWLNTRLLDDTNIYTCLGDILESRPDLLIIDNCDQHDPPSVLMDFLFERMGQTKILLTTRSSVRSNIDVHCIHLPPLCYKDFKRLLQLLIEHNYDGGADPFSDRESRRAYTVCHGNPQQLCQLVHLACAYPFEEAVLLLDLFTRRAVQEGSDLLSYYASHF